MPTPPTTLLDLAPSLQTPGFRLVDAGELFQLFTNLLGFRIVPTAGGATLASGVALGPGLNFIETAVVLPPATVLGQVVSVVNNDPAFNSLAVFGSEGDFIVQNSENTDSATADNIYVGCGVVAKFTCVKQGYWLIMQ